ncbi:MAG TPA: indole-3-glycerol phosphate synthase TrpC [Acidobacteriaceae bacterium]|nr:indole-3-glycerol phosphate synthase TrpC [Acidobacteriaceae bacterium]
MSTQLERILAHTRQEVAARRAAADFAALERQAAAHRPRGFEAALRTAAKHGPAVIAELKKASPSRGLIRADFNPAALATSLEAAGATALSVLTDREFFQGSLENLTRASAAVKIPCLRKDFIFDPFQIVEARAAGADAILLIVAALTDSELRSLYAEAKRLELDVLCEVHDTDELDRAVALGFTVLGVNSRNLHTMQVDPEGQIELARKLPKTAVRVAESGIQTQADMARMSAAGYDAFLIGESLMREPDAAATLAALLAREVTAKA